MTEVKEKKKSNILGEAAATCCREHLIFVLDIITKFQK